MKWPSVSRCSRCICKTAPKPKCRREEAPREKYTETHSQRVYDHSPVHQFDGDVRCLRVRFWNTLGKQITATSLAVRARDADRNQSNVQNERAHRAQPTTPPPNHPHASASNANGMRRRRWHRFGAVSAAM